MSESTEKARRYSRTHAERFRHELHEFLRIPSLSGDPAHAGDVKRAAEWLAEHMRALGLENVGVMPTAGHPVVYGEWLGAGPDKPTVLVYGHYDVVPAAMEDGWDTPPFEPVEKDGKIYARGATDDKGQLFIHVKALESYLEGRRWRAGQREISDRGRRRGLVPQPGALHRGAPGPAQGRRLRDQRFVDAHDRRAGHHAQPARHDLHRGRGRGTERRPAQRLLGRRGAQSRPRARRDPGQALQPRQQHRGARASTTTSSR